ncbi:homoserine O-acetyltransferase [Pseudomonas sp. H1h]|uniref:homoserine O-acetyltransferase MetX n=1 Tax=Pseudomonas sp. H1h TaxID=1397280 RepID=UPI00046A1DC2|nr:homoserine O-acetyltransferase [Pseudomonas sp. H1h]
MVETLPAADYIAFTRPFPMHRGGVLEDLRLTYETFGQLNERRDNVVLILPGMSANSHVCSVARDPESGWWEDFAGPAKPIDTDRWFVICFNYLGGCKGTTGPMSIDPRSGRPYRSRFPELAIEDIADTIVMAMKALDMDEVACLIGTSMGGMCALALLTRHPGFVRHHINLCGAASSLPVSTALRSLQREAIRSDPLWAGGEYSPDARPIHGMTLARKMGLLSYRSGAELNRRFARPDESAGKSAGTAHDFEVEDYLQANACRFARDFDPNSYLQLSRAIDLYACLKTPRGGFQTVGLEQVLVVGVESDTLFPVAQQQHIAQGLGQDGAQVTFVRLDCRDGHDAFLTDLQAFGPLLENFMNRIGSVLPAGRAERRLELHDERF